MHYLIQYINFSHERCLICNMHHKSKDLMYSNVLFCHPSSKSKWCFTGMVKTEWTSAIRFIFRKSYILLFWNGNSDLKYVS